MRTKQDIFEDKLSELLLEIQPYDCTYNGYGCLRIFFDENDERGVDVRYLMKKCFNKIGWCLK